MVCGNVLVTKPICGIREFNMMDCDQYYLQVRADATTNGYGM